MLNQKPHHRFRREGPNLYTSKDVLLSEALCGCKLVVKHLDGRTLLLSTRRGQVIRPGVPKMVIGEGDYTMMKHHTSDHTGRHADK